MKTMIGILLWLAFLTPLKLFSSADNAGHKWKPAAVQNYQISPLSSGFQDFKGMGLEVSSNLLRLSAFYGSLNSMEDDDTARSRFFRTQYIRTGYALKLGIEKSGNSLDLFYFRAKDDPNSLPQSENPGIGNPQKNVVAGLNFHLKTLKIFTLTGELALSELNSDRAAHAVASQTTIAIDLANFQTSIGYLVVQPGFASLGNQMLTDDQTMLTFTSNLTLLKGNFNIFLNFRQENHGLQRKNEYRWFISNGDICINSRISKRFNLNLSLSGNISTHEYGTELTENLITDSQRIFQVAVDPAYEITGSYLSHRISGNLKLEKREKSGVFHENTGQNHHISVSASHRIFQFEMNRHISIKASYAKVAGGDQRNESYGGVVSAGTKLFKAKKIGIDGTAGAIYNKGEGEISGLNLSFGTTISYFSAKNDMILHLDYQIENRCKVCPGVSREFPRKSRHIIAGSVSYSRKF
jgi:hypothetical protein